MKASRFILSVCALSIMGICGYAAGSSWSPSGPTESKTKSKQTPQKAEEKKQKTSPAEPQEMGGNTTKPKDTAIVPKAGPGSVEPNEPNNYYPSF